VEPTPVESVIINPGERYDFIITANQSVGNYWIRVDSMEVCDVSLAFNPWTYAKFFQQKACFSSA